jgi:hypothetical protein
MHVVCPIRPGLTPPSALVGSAVNHDARHHGHARERELGERRERFVALTLEIGQRDAACEMKRGPPKRAPSLPSLGDRGNYRR